MSRKKVAPPRTKTTIAQRKEKLQAQLKKLETREQISALQASLKK